MFTAVVLKFKENWIIDLVFRILVIISSLLLLFYQNDGYWLEILLVGMVISTFKHHRPAAGMFMFGYGFIMYRDVTVMSVCLSIVAGFAISEKS